MTQFLNSAFSGRSIRVQQILILTSGCQTGDYPCPWIRFLPLHPKLSLHLIQISSMSGRQNHSTCVFQRNKYNFPAIKLFPKTLCAAARRICSNITNADKSPFNTKGQIACLTTLKNVLIVSFYLLKGMKSTLLT